MGRLFGTDGVRGVANVDLTPELVFRLGRAAAHVLSTDAGTQFLLGRDTRLSGPMLEAALTAAVCSAGGTVLSCGILPTPAVAYLTRRVAASAGVVISASHNPIEDNGIKVFASDGYKLPDAVEDAIETVLDRHDLPRAVGREVGGAEVLSDAADIYVDHIASHVVGSLGGMRVVVDCAYGAACRVASMLWERLGATVILINDEPDGARINVRCGSTNPEVLRQAADAGFAHDGDADRVIAVDETGSIIDGDAIMGVCAMYLHTQGRLARRTVVATVMSNLGLELALRRAGIALERTKVGDRYVLERMREFGATVGGEQSGHIIFLDHATTGDGALTAVQVVNVMLETGQRLSELAAPIERFPQVLLNVTVADRGTVTGHPAIEAAVGTEPLVRVMVEAQDEGEAESLAGHLADLIARELRGRRA